MIEVEIWSDIVCPWCYIGKRRFEAALAQFPQRDQVKITWRSFQLDPTASNVSAQNLAEELGQKFGGQQKAEGMLAQVTNIAAEVGLEYHMDKAYTGNTKNAHRLIHLAKHHGLQGEMKERLMRAHFTESLPHAEIESLVKLGVEVGLDEKEIRDMFAGDAYSKAFDADVERAHMLGIGGVPFFLFNEKYAVSGAQPTELFLSALNKTWDEFGTKFEMVGGDTDASCTDESCAI